MNKLQFYRIATPIPAFKSNYEGLIVTDSFENTYIGMHNGWRKIVFEDELDGKIRNIINSYESEGVNIHYDYEYVDLGLISGNLWAKCNIGATEESEYGYLYAWGETTRKETFTDANYSFYVNGNNENITKYNSTDGKVELDAEDDAARQVMGGMWTMPSSADYQELISQTTREWVDNYKYTGVSGILFKSTVNHNTLFFPASGFKDGGNISERNDTCSYWTSNIFSTAPRAALNLWATDSTASATSTNSRRLGMSIRGVLYTS